ncbi:diacylglycerol kinase family protein [Microbacterium sp. USHLN186]|uniref:diacylglycerol kinase family protein n=1 Tax=Microbacterium sp. USHLN186 TaxID=3081286 RepID=UPI00301A899F
MAGHIAVLGNPRAGMGRGRRATDGAVAALRDAGADVRVHVGRSAAETAALAAGALAEHPSALVVVGGDGTLSGIVHLLQDGPVPLVIVPAGTGDDLARALDLPRRDPAAAALLALHGRERTVDVGEVRSGASVHPFLTVAALGFDACVSDRTNRLRWPRGRGRYHLAVAIEVLRLRALEFVITMDGAPPEHAPGTLIAVGNTASYGGGMPICTGADVGDGLLDIVEVAPLSRGRLVRLFPLLLRGAHLHRREVRHRRARSVHVSAAGLVVYADGERLGEEECTITVRPSALRIMTAGGGERDVRVR